MLLMAISAAFGSTLATVLWVDLFGTKELARVRSAVDAGAVLASGASPIIMGLLIDAGLSLSLQALACCVYSIGASLVALGVRASQSFAASHPPTIRASHKLALGRLRTRGVG
nr:MFS transporter [Rhizobium sp. Khangiran2]